MPASGPRQGEARPILLDAYAARNCPVKVHNKYDRTVLSNPEGAEATSMRGASEALSEVFAGSATVRSAIWEVITAAGLQVVDLRPLADQEWPEREEATSEAVAAGAEVIVNPVCPVDTAGHRYGSPSLLIRDRRRADGGWGYLPVQIKASRLLSRAGASGQTMWLTRLRRPLPDQASEVPLALRSTMEPAMLQLAHYWRVLEASGWEAPGPARGGLIGTDDTDLLLASAPMPRRVTQLNPEGLAIGWVQLTERRLRTFSRTSPTGWRLRAPLERYDHEFGFRVKVAQVARQRTGRPEDPAPMVTPIVIPECETCQWWASCRPQLGSDDISLRVDKAPLDVREITALRSLGISTIQELGEADLDTVMADYLRLVQHRPRVEERLRTAAHRAQLLAAGVELERRTTGPIPVRRSSIEIDLDIETSADDRTYLWGWLITEGGQQRYLSHVRFSDLSRTQETRLAKEALGWMVSFLQDHPEALIYHYSDYEVVHILRLAETSKDPLIARAAELARTRFVDLFALMRTHFFGAHGLGLKQVAGASAGFSWRDEEPGGLNSQHWFVDAVHAPETEARQRAAQRVLDYNEDDVRATFTLREWLSAQR